MVLAGPRRRIADAGQRLVAFSRRHQVVGAVTDVADLRRHRRRQPVFDERVPLVCELRAEVRIVGRGRCLTGSFHGTSSAKPVPVRPGPGGQVVGDGGLEEQRRVERKPQVGAGALHELGDPVAAAHDGPLGRAPGDAEARLVALVIRLVERALLDAAVLREDLLAGREIEVRLPIVFLDQRRRVCPAQAEIQRQVRSDLEVVLREERDPVLQVRPRIFWVAAAAPLAVDLVEQEVGERALR